MPKKLSMAEKYSYDFGASINAGFEIYKFYASAENINVSYSLCELLSNNA